MTKPRLKILIISREKRAGEALISIQRQIDQLKTIKDLEVTQMIASGKGITGYVTSYKRLIKKIKVQDFDIIHAHYSFTGVIALLAAKREKTIVSLMGSDLFSNSFIQRMARNFVLKRAEHVIVKSQLMLDNLERKNKISVIPNGVDLDQFKPSDKLTAKNKLNWPSDKINILFGAGPFRREKNFELASSAVNDIQNRYSIAFHYLKNIEPPNVPNYLNAADIVLLTSKWEGSSNVTKETMACNTVMVSTKVGDTELLFNNIKGYYLTDHNIPSVKDGLEKAINFINQNTSTQGRERLKQLKLDNSSSLEKLIQLYSEVKGSNNFQDINNS